MTESFAERESRERAEARSQRLAERRASRRTEVNVTLARGDRLTVTETITAGDPTVELVETGPPSTTANFAPEDVGDPVELVVTHASPAPRTSTRYGGLYTVALCENCDELIIRFEVDDTWDHMDTGESMCDLPI